MPMEKFYHTCLLFTCLLSFTLRAIAQLNIHADSIGLESAVRNNTEASHVEKESAKLDLTPFEAIMEANHNARSFLTIEDAEAKTICDVKVYPVPATNAIQLSYHLQHNTQVTIKVMDVLGNEILTLMCEEVPSGDKHHTFYLADLLGKGIYFLRITVDGETVIKRVSIF